MAGAEAYLWPDMSLESQFPEIKGKKYLCSGLMIGYTDAFWNILNYEVSGDCFYFWLNSNY